MRTTARGAAVALALVGVMAGCGRGDGTEEVAVVRDLDLMEGVDAAGSARMAFSMDATQPAMGLGGESGPVARMVTEGEGVVGFSTREARWSGTWRMEATEPEGSVDEYLDAPAMHIEVIEGADGSWSRFWVDGEEPPGWSEDEVSDDELDDEDGDDSSLLDSTTMDPTAFLDRLREEAGTVTTVGEEEVRGDITTRYRAEVDADVLEVGEEGDQVAVDVWIDEQERLRKVETEGMELELWDFGTPVDTTAPTDLGDPDDLGFFDDALPAVTGDWAPAASGAVGDVAWTVYAAPGEVLGAPTTCRTLEVDGDPSASGDPMESWGELPFPQHDGVLAECGNGTMAAIASGFVAAPALQVLTTDVGFDLSSEAFDTALVGFVVAPEHADGGITIVRDGADPVPLTLDAAGIAVWDGKGSAPVTAIELDGGAVTCSFAATEEGDVGFEPGVMGAGFGLTPPVCVQS